MNEIYDAPALRRLRGFCRSTLLPPPLRPSLPPLPDFSPPPYPPSLPWLYDRHGRCTAITLPWQRMVWASTTPYTGTASSTGHNTAHVHTVFSGLAPDCACLSRLALFPPHRQWCGGMVCVSRIGGGYCVVWYDLVWRDAAILFASYVAPMTRRH